MEIDEGTWRRDVSFSEVQGNKMEIEGTMHRLIT
jgi:hypothetical protein